MSLTLAIDTSTTVCAALARDGEVIAQGNIADTRAHAEALMPLINDLIAQAGATLADLTHVAVGVGPGPFTGLRVGVVTALTLASLNELTGRPATSIQGVCSLDVLAADWVGSDNAPEGEFLVALDARRKELYWARYAAVGTRIDGPNVSAPDDLPELPICGPGATVYPGMLVAGPRELNAGVLATGHFVDAGLEPLYLRKPDAVEATTRKSTLVQPRLRVRPLRGQR